MWVCDPDAGGVKIPEALKSEVRRRIEAYAAEHFAGHYTRLDIRFRAQFCYVGAFTEPATGPGTIGGETYEQRVQRLRETPMQLCRLRHFSRDRWSCGFFKYSDMKYELCMTASGDFICTPEEGFEIAASAYLS